MSVVEICVVESCLECFSVFLMLTSGSPDCEHKECCVLTVMTLSPHTVTCQLHFFSL